MGNTLNHLTVKPLVHKSSTVLPGFVSQDTQVHTRQWPSVKAVAHVLLITAVVAVLAKPIPMAILCHLTVAVLVPQTLTATSCTAA